jgi:putative transposase
MSGKGDCYDNAMVGMFFKVEIRAGLAHRPSIRAQAKNRLAGYIDGFYNPIQRYSSLTFPQPGTVRKTRPRVLRQCLSTLRNKSRFTHDVGGAVRRRPPARSRPPNRKGSQTASLGYDRALRVASTAAGQRTEAGAGYDAFSWASIMPRVTPTNCPKSSALTMRCFDPIRRHWLKP